MVISNESVDESLRQAITIFLKNAVKKTLGDHNSTHYVEKTQVAQDLPGASMTEDGFVALKQNIVEAAKAVSSQKIRK